MAFASVGPLAAVLGRMGLSYILQPEDVPASFSLCAMPAPSSARSQGAPQTGRPQPPSWQARAGAQARPSWRERQTRPAAPQQSRQAPPPRQTPQSQQTFQPQQAPQPQQTFHPQQAPQPQRRPAYQPPQQATQQSPQASKRPAAWRTNGLDVLQRTVAPPIPFTRIAPEAWPALWQHLHARMKKAWLCWSYWELGEDLCGTADPGRRQMLGQLISSLQRPAGTSTFWPPAIPADKDSGQSGLVPSRDLFWSGVQELGVRMIVAMGFRASVAIGLPQEEVRPLHWEIRNGVIVCTTWDFFRIAEQPSRLGDIATFLSATIRQLGL